jgi:hypothetical protein
MMNTALNFISTNITTFVKEHKKYESHELSLFSKTQEGVTYYLTVKPWKSPSLKQTKEVLERAGVSQSSFQVIRK